MKIKHNEFTTSMPDDWQDRTMITLVAPFTPGGFAANVVVTRHDVAATQSIEDFVAEQLEMLRSNLPSFELIDMRNTSVQGFPASQQLHRFRAESGFCSRCKLLSCAAALFSRLPELRGSTNSTDTSPLFAKSSRIFNFKKRMTDAAPKI